MIFNHAVNTSTARQQLWARTDAAVEVGPYLGAHPREGAGKTGSAQCRGLE